MPFFRGKRGHCVTPIEVPAEQQYFLKWPILELGAKGNTELPFFRGLGG